MRASPLRLLRTAGGTAVDQVLSALSNLVLAVVVARSVSAGDFGAFSVAFLVYGIAIAATRSLIGQPVQIRFSAQPEADIRRAAARALGASVPVGLLAAGVCLVAGWLLPGATGAAMLALAVVLPFLLVQDNCRMIFFALGRSWRAALIDAVWAGLQVVLILVLIEADRASTPVLVLAWGVTGAVSAAAGLALLRVRPRVSSALGWLRDQQDLSRYLLAEYVLGLGAMQVGILLVGVVASTTSVGALRAAQVLLGPMGIMATAAFQFVMPEIARRPHLTRRQLLTVGLGGSGVLATITLGYVVVLLLMPASFGRMLFGDSWDGASLVLLAMGISATFSAMANGSAAVLYGTGRARQTFLITVGKGPLLLALLLLGTWQWGTQGSAWALAAIEAIVLPAWVITLLRATRHPAPAPGDPVAGAVAVGPTSPEPAPHPVRHTPDRDVAPSRPTAGSALPADDTGGTR